MVSHEDRTWADDYIGISRSRFLVAHDLATLTMKKILSIKCDSKINYIFIYSNYFR